MQQNLDSFKNPLSRSLAVSVTAGSAITMASAIALSLSQSNETAHRAAVYSTLAGSACGAVIGLLYPQKTQPAIKEKTISSAWQNWRQFIVVRKVKESEEITSFYLQPKDGGAIASFQPGQFLTIKLEIPGQAKPVIRTYSLSDYAESSEFYRISVKREPMPAGSNFMPGIASNFMHDQVQEGAVISVKPPSGQFVLDLHQSLPAILISNGVGITPMISMLKAAVRHSHRPIWFIHGARNGHFHAFREEVTTFAAEHPHAQIHFAYSRPQVEDTGHYHSTGYITPELVTSLIHQDAEYFLCGSPVFMQSLRNGLRAAGIPDHRVFFEAFTQGNSKSAEVASVSAEVSDRAEVVFAASGKTATWQPGAGSLLEFAEANDLEPDYSCRQGICGTCACRLIAGEVNYQETPVAAIAEGSVLICIAQPKTQVVLDL